MLFTSAARAFRSRASATQYTVMRPRDVVAAGVWPMIPDASSAYAAKGDTGNAPASHPAGAVSWDVSSKSSVSGPPSMPLSDVGSGTNLSLWRCASCARRKDRPLTMGFVIVLIMQQMIPHDPCSAGSMQQYPCVVGPSTHLAGHRRGLPGLRCCLPYCSCGRGTGTGLSGPSIRVCAFRHDLLIWHHTVHSSISFRVIEAEESRVGPGELGSLHAHVSQRTL